MEPACGCIMSVHYALYIVPGTLFCYTRVYSLILSCNIIHKLFSISNGNFIAMLFVRKPLQLVNPEEWIQSSTNNIECSWLGQKWDRKLDVVLAIACTLCVTPLSTAVLNKGN